jgi:ATP-dependent RNA helicase DeaD
MTASQPAAADSTPSGPEPGSFAALGLSGPALAALADIGYESPSPIQAATIPPLLAGEDVLGQAQTGTGKTAAFALPLLSRIVLDQRDPQALVMVPTRELAIQVAEAFQKYAAQLPGFRVLPIYGGQSYAPQLQALKRGVHVVVGTPGRIIDHLERGTLSLAGIRLVVLDEADEMLQMGFVDAIEAILAKTPPGRQTALFSATMAAPIRRIAQRHLRNPREITIRGRTSTAANTRQRYWLVDGLHKLDALTRILEVEPFDAMLVFTRTKQSTLELAERLQARGFAAAALNGDMLQAQRERTIAQLKAGEFDILVATDVAARGLDVERIDHVVNFDIPYDAESYIHRIGRPGRAGRSGDAILFVSPRERNMLRLIERATRQPIEPMRLPTVEDVNSSRTARFTARITAALAAGAGHTFRSTLEEYVRATGADPLDVAAALASLAPGPAPLNRGSRDPDVAPRDPDRDSAPGARGAAAPPAQDARPARADPAADAGEMRGSPARSARERAPRFEPQDTYRLAVGRAHGLQPGNIVGLLANEADLHGSQINGIDIQHDHSFVRLPKGMPEAMLQRLQGLKLKGRFLQITPVAPRTPRRGGPELAAPRPPRRKKPAR